MTGQTPRCRHDFCYVQPPGSDSSYLAAVRDRVDRVQDTEFGESFFTPETAPTASATAWKLFPWQHRGFLLLSEVKDTGLPRARASHIPPRGREKSPRRTMAIPPWGSRARGGGSLA